jgi:hypothetical protein
MKKLDKPLFTDRRKKPITVKGTKVKVPKNLSSSMFAPTTDLTSQMPSDMSSATPMADASAPAFNSGGIVSRGQGKIIKTKTTKYC